MFVVTMIVVITREKVCFLRENMPGKAGVSADEHRLSRLVYESSDTESDR
jgi:hypothetical protein